LPLLWVGLLFLSSTTKLVIQSFSFNTCSLYFPIRPILACDELGCEKLMI
jgi:hypothetical protein